MRNVKIESEVLKMCKFPFVKIKVSQGIRTEIQLRDENSTVVVVIS